MRSKFILRAIDFWKGSGCLQSLNGVVPVLLCRTKAPNGKLGIAFFQHASSKRFNRRHAKVPFGLIHGVAAAIVGVADDAVRPIADQLSLGAISVAEAGL